MRRSDQYGTLEWFRAEYGKVPQDPWGLSWRSSQLLRYHRVLSKLETIEEPVSRILDVGCATGDFTELLSRSQKFKEVIGVDFVESAVARARNRFPARTFAAGSIFDLGETYTQQFDAVACLEVLYYLEASRREAALRSLGKVLRRGGYAVFSSLIGPAPHFCTDELVAVVGNEFKVVSVETLHLRPVSLIEKAGSKAARLVERMASTTDAAQFFRRLTTLPLSAVASLENWSRAMRQLSASHTIVLARVPT